ncbi:MAG: hypothetical protein ACRDZQ_00085 [Acidimicrobiales bacterium]
MSTFIWPSEDGWPYPDDSGEVADAEADVDEDALVLHCLSGHALDGLDPLERLVVAGRFGIGGAPVRSMKELQADTGRDRQEIRQALGTGLAKLRVQLA